MVEAGQVAARRCRPLLARVSLPRAQHEYLPPQHGCITGHAMGFSDRLRQYVMSCEEPITSEDFMLPCVCMPDSPKAKGPHKLHQQLSYNQVLRVAPGVTGHALQRIV